MRTVDVCSAAWRVPVSVRRRCPTTVTVLETTASIGTGLLRRPVSALALRFGCHERTLRRGLAVLRDHGYVRTVEAAMHHRACLRQLTMPK